MPGDGRKLVRSISARQFFAMSFGSVVGVGWIVVLGDAVGQAGPGGAELALGLGGLAVLLVAFCYAEMAARLPAAFVAPGGRPLVITAAAASLVIAGVALIQPWFAAKGAIPAESLALAGWTGIALMMWWGSRATRTSLTHAERALVLRGDAVHPA